MTRIPKISCNSMIKYVSKKGFTVLKQKGSHVRLRKGGMFTTIPAGNSMLKIGTLLAVLHDCEITRDEFIMDYNSGFVK